MLDELYGPFVAQIIVKEGEIRFGSAVADLLGGVLRGCWTGLEVSPLARIPSACSVSAYKACTMAKYGRTVSNSNI